MGEGRKFRTSLAGRSILALALFIGFYALAIAMAGFLLLVPYAGIRLHLPTHLYIGIFYLACIGAAGLILWSVIPRPERFKAPGPRLTPQSDPRLFEEIDRLARDLGQKAPREAYLMPGVTAWVSERGGFMGIGRRRIVGVGLTLLEALSTSEFRAVLAHEFGHFSHGDTWLGPWIFRTRNTIGRTIQKLPVLSGFGKTASAIGALSQRLFILYGNWFMRITQAVSRRQEYLADEHSAAIVGRETAISTLRAVFMADQMHSGYWVTLLGPSLNAGYLPPYAAGFEEFAGFAPNREMALKALDWEIGHVQSQPHDSHPSLGERIKALEALPPGHIPETAPSAILLLDDVPRHERELFVSMNPEAGSKLKPIDWDDVTAVALVPYWTELAKVNRAHLAGLTPKGVADRLPALAGSWLQEVRDTGQPLAGDLAEDMAKSNAAGLIAVALVTKMIERGWQASGRPGRYTVLRLGGQSWEPFRILYELAAGKTSGDDWLRLCDELGIGDIELGTGEPAEGDGATASSAGPAADMPGVAPSAGSQSAPRKVPYALIAIIAICVMAFMAGLIGPGRPGGDTGYQFVPSTSGPSPFRGGKRWEEPPAQPSSATAVPFSLTRHESDLVANVTRTSSKAGSYEIEGTIVNRSNRTYHFIMVEVELLDSLGKVVGKLKTVAQREKYVVPGGVEPFKVRGLGNLNWRTVRASVVYSVAVN